MGLHVKLIVCAALVVWPFAQSASPEALSGGAGWLGAGLLGAVLCWLLLRHLPEKDKQLDRLMTNHTAGMEGLTKAHDQSVEKILTEKAAERKEHLTAFREESAASRAVFEREQAAQRDMHHKLYAINTQQHAENSTKLQAILEMATATRQAVQDCHRCKNFHPSEEGKA